MDEITQEDKIRVDILNKIWRQMETELLEEGKNYLYEIDDPEDDYKKGVLNCIRLIQLRVHYILD